MDCGLERLDEVMTEGVCRRGYCEVDTGGNIYHGWLALSRGHGWDLKMVEEPGVGLPLSIDIDRCYDVEGIVNRE